MKPHFKGLLKVFQVLWPLNSIFLSVVRSAYCFKLVLPHWKFAWVSAHLVYFVWSCSESIFLNKRWDLGWRREMQNLISSLLSWGTRVWYSPYSIYPCLYIVYPLPYLVKQLSTERFPFYRFGPFFDWSSKYFSAKFLLPALVCTGLNANIGFAADVNTIWRLWECNKSVFKICLVENLLNLAL